MKKDTEAVTWRETWQIFLRSVRLLERYTPRVFLSMAINSAVSAVTPWSA